MFAASFKKSKTTNNMANKVGIIGSAAVAKALAKGFLGAGSQVMLGSRDPKKLAEWKEESGNKASTGTFAEAAAFGEIVVLAVAGHAATSALEAAGAQNLSGKTIIDATNPIAEKPPVDGVLEFFTDINKSLMEELQATYPDAHFVKAFNSVGNISMVHPEFKDGTPTMFICGNDDSAKAEATTVIKSFGWEVADMGKATAARAIEPLSMLWCIDGFLKNDWTHAFKVLR